MHGHTVNLHKKILTDLSYKEDNLTSRSFTRAGKCSSSMLGVRKQQSCTSQAKDSILGPIKVLQFSQEQENLELFQHI